MKPSTLLLGLAAGQAALAYPAGSGFDSVLAEIQARAAIAPAHVEERSFTLLGDLLRGVFTKVGAIIKDILEGKQAAGEDRGTTYRAPGPLGSRRCDRDACCAMSYAVDEMAAAFTDRRGCTDLARGAIRAGFHDAFPWDPVANTGGADGSLVLAAEEMTRIENRGLEPAVDQLRAWHAKYARHGVGMADLVQMAATTAVASCPGGPRVRSFVGRADRATPNAPFQIPPPFFSADQLIGLFGARSLDANDLVALVGAHTASRQRFVDPARAGTPQDSTPQTWDSNYYGETIRSDNSTIVTFLSDKNLAQDSRTAPQFRNFANPASKPAWDKVRRPFPLFPLPPPGDTAVDAHGIHATRRERESRRRLTGRRPSPAPTSA